jgi:hypothetical protein
MKMEIRSGKEAGRMERKMDFLLFGIKKETLQKLKHTKMDG